MALLIRIHFHCCFYNIGWPLALNVDVSTDFLLEGAHVLLQWTHNESFVSYNVNISPPADVTVNYTSANFTATYNILYTVSVVAQLQCSQESVSSDVEVEYGKHYSSHN